MQISRNSNQIMREIKELDYTGRSSIHVAKNSPGAGCQDA